MHFPGTWDVLPEHWGLREHRGSVKPCWGRWRPVHGADSREGVWKMGRTEMSHRGDVPGDQQAEEGLNPSAEAKCAWQAVGSVTCAARLSCLGSLWVLERFACSYKALLGVGSCSGQLVLEMESSASPPRPWFGGVAVEWCWGSFWSSRYRAKDEVKVWQSIWEGLPEGADWDSGAVGTQVQC